MNEVIINHEEFNSRTNNKWFNESLELFKCGKCKVIIVGVPYCHIAYYDPKDLKKTFQYNVPRKIHCPKCNHLWYDNSERNEYDTEEVSLDELILSDWKWLQNAI
jgi:hypothetical protein